MRDFRFESFRYDFLEKYMTKNKGINNVHRWNELDFSLPTPFSVARLLLCGKCICGQNYGKI